MYVFNREGELVDNLSEDPLIPRDISIGSITVRDGSVYTWGMKKELGGRPSNWSVSKFDGKKWSTL